MTWTVEFFADDRGRQPAREWLQSLDSAKRAAAIAEIETARQRLRAFKQQQSRRRAPTRRRR
jgi:hypothetical protein